MTAICRQASALSSRSDPIPLSALQHWLYCPRQYALIHVEQIWAENRLTAEGRVMHERVDTGGGETRPGIRILRDVELRSDRLGLHGRADVVELRGGVPYPVEYKRGRPKTHRADEVQLCAQSLCLEDMFSCAIPEAALFYGKTRRRKRIALDTGLRDLTCDTIKAVRACRDAAQVPAPVTEDGLCAACSLLEHCRPQVVRAGRNVHDWLSRAVGSTRTPE